MSESRSEAAPNPAAETVVGEDKAAPQRMKLEEMTEADEIYERIEELSSEIYVSKEKLKRIDGQLADLRSGLGDQNDLMDIRGAREVCAGRVMILEHAQNQARFRLDLISNATRSMLVKAMAALRTVLFRLLRKLQKKYNENKSEKTKRLRDLTERRLIDTTAILAIERENQSSSDEVMEADFEERVSWLVGGDAKKALADLNSSAICIPRALDETARIEKFMIAERQQGTGAKIILLLKHFTLSRCGVRVVDLSYNSLGIWSNLIFTSLAQNETLIDLRLRGCGLEDDSIKCFSEYFLTNQTLTNLDLSNNRITANGAALLGKCLESCECKSLTRILLGDQDLTMEGSGHGGLLALAAGLKNMEYVRLNNCCIYADGVCVLQRMMGMNLFHLDLSMNYLTDRGAAQLSSHLRRALRLAVLRLRGCFIHDRGFGLLVDVIFGEWRQRERQLQFLDLSDNRVSDRGIKHLVDLCEGAIPRGVSADAPFSVQEVRLCDNAITCAGAKLLGAALAQCRERTSSPDFSHGATGNPVAGGGQPFMRYVAFESELDLSGTFGRLDVCHLLESHSIVAEGWGIGSLGAAAAAQILRQNDTCSRVSLRGNHVDTEAAAQFVAGLAQKGGMKALQHLDLSSNLIRLNNLVFAGKFFRSLAKLKTLRSLKVDSNEQKDDALWGWASYLAVNPPLRALSIRDQDYTRRKALSNLLQNLRFNNRLVVLDLRYNPAVINEYVFQAESLNMVAKELEVTNPGLRCLPFHEDPAEVVRAPRRRIPGRPDLYPTLKVFTHDMMHRQRRARVGRFETLMKQKGRLHVRRNGRPLIVL